jgi:hypothetical protein
VSPRSRSWETGLPVQRALWIALVAATCIPGAAAQAPQSVDEDLVPEAQSDQQPASTTTVPKERTGSSQQESKNVDDPPPATAPVKDPNDGRQSKRILWVFPNYRAVSANVELPRLTLKNKFWLATQDSFDYSAFVSAGMFSGVSEANKSYPEFGQGAKGYGRYYWHAMADQAVGNYLTEAVVPSITHEDPRYYTLGHGGFLKRTGYAVSRLLVTRTDAGGRTFNLSEIIGNGAGAGVSDTYYPARERTWTKTGQKWVTQIALDGVFNILKEFWPDINQAIFRGKY